MFAASVFLVFFNDLLVSFFDLKLLIPSFFQFDPFCRVLLSRACLFILRWPAFFEAVTMNVAMTHLWSLPMWIMSLASASSLYFMCLLLIMMWSICFSFPSGDLQVVFPRILSLHRVECCTSSKKKQIKQQQQKRHLSPMRRSQRKTWKSEDLSRREEPRQWTSRRHSTPSHTHQCGTPSNLMVSNMTTCIS